MATGTVIPPPPPGFELDVPPPPPGFSVEDGKRRKSGDSSLVNIIAGAVEPNLSMLTGMMAQPVAGLAGLGAGIANLFGAQTSPGAVTNKTANALTYAPKTKGGQDAMSVLGYLPEKYGELAHAAGEKSAEVTDSPAIGAIVNTILGVAPGALGKRGNFDTTSVADGASRRLMQSALKPSVEDMRRGDAQKAITTLLDEGVNVTPGGSRKLGDRVLTLNEEISKAIGGSTATVDKYAAANRLQDLIREREKQATPNADVAAITRNYDEFTQNHPLIPGRDMPVQLAQEIKKGTYRQLRDKYGEMGSADVEAQKTIARGLKEEISAAVPEVGPLNARESELLNAKNILDRRVLVAGNKNPLGISHLSPRLGNLAAGVLDRSEIVKSLLARLLAPDRAKLVPDASIAAATAPQSFSDDVQKREAIIKALMEMR